MQNQLPTGMTLAKPATSSAGGLPSGMTLATPAPTPTMAAQTGTNLKNTFTQGGANVTNDIMANPDQSNAMKVGLGTSVLTDLQKAGNVAGDIAGTAGGILGSVISPFLPQGVKNAVGNVTKYVSDKVNSIPGMTPQIAKGLSDVFNTATLAGGGEAEPTVTGAANAAVDKVGDLAQDTIKPVSDYIAGGANKLSDNLQEASLKLTPTQKINLGSKLTDVKNYLSDNNITGNPTTRFNAVDTIYNQKEVDLQNFLTKDAKDVTVSKQQLTSQINKIKAGYQYDRDSLAVGRQIDEAIKTINTKFPGKEIPVSNLNVFKRSTYAGAYNTAGSKVLDTVEHDIGDVAKENIETATKGMTINGKPIADFNKEYGTIINARKILKAAQGKPQLGLTGKIVSSIVGGAAGKLVGGGIAGEVLGGMVGPKAGEFVAGTAAKSKLASLLKR